MAALVIVFLLVLVCVLGPLRGVDSRRFDDRSW